MQYIAAEQSTYHQTYFHNLSYLQYKAKHQAYYDHAKRSEIYESRYILFRHLSSYYSNEKLFGTMSFHASPNAVTATLIEIYYTI